MSDTKTIDQSQSGRSRAYQRLTPETAVLLLIDHQSGLVSGVRDLAPDEVRHNVVAFARAARVLRVPVVLTSTAPMMWGPTLPELTEALPGVENIERSFINAWDEPRIRDAVTRTGRQKLLIGGITTHVCLAFPAMSAVADGYDVYALWDASGTLERSPATNCIRTNEASGRHNNLRIGGVRGDAAQQRQPNRWRVLRGA